MSGHTDTKNLIPYGKCHCGCGGETSIAKSTYAKCGRKKGEPCLFICGHSTRGELSKDWKGGRHITNKGYVLIKVYGHPRANPNGYVFEHIIVLERSLHRFILPGEATHHIDGDRSNNAIGNLMLFKNNNMHRDYHIRLRAFKVSGHYDWRNCPYCKQYDDPQNMVRQGHNFVHRICRSNYDRDRRSG